MKDDERKSSAGDITRRRFLGASLAVGGCALLPRQGRAAHSVPPPAGTGHWTEGCGYDRGTDIETAHPAPLRRAI